MLQSASRERFIRIASLATLAMTILAAGIATAIHWSSPQRRLLDLVVPPSIFIVFSGLLITLLRRPQWVGGIMRCALLAGLVALAAPAWVYTWQATVTPGLRLVDIYPPVTALFMALLVMVMIYLPARAAWIAVVACWLLVALPVLAYLFTHTQELHTPRGTDLLMAYGPVFVLLAVLLPVQRGLTGRIQALVSEQAKMEAVVNRDPLTRLYNRRFGEHVLQDMLAGQVPGGVIMFDMDRFKAINDTHGHPVGDAVLQRVAQRCQELMRKDECLARWGGEEFLIAVPRIEIGDLKLMAERLRSAIAELSIAPVAHISASIGITPLHRDDTYASLLQRVDQALYRAKQRGGNIVMW
ncbi:GGDEF domain-containing protein [Pseudoxanthomonas sp. GM95]|uniref:GGDEF domain-containing protein n=1 Tax=Pseudoxanthomonas sp. GM95 TaxID=1881043 RepID=UPI001587D8F2|nr:GGDEF domain-containing protein [Pseudoxanthomonas sp. GM95]